MKESYNITEIEIGMSASYSQTITDADVKQFAAVSGDKNPMHMDDVYASDSRFKGRISHGMLSASFFSALFGTQLPGKGCVYVSQNLNFKRPVYLGDTVTAKIVVNKVDIKGKKVSFKTICTVKNKIVIDGSAVIFMQ